MEILWSVAFGTSMRLECWSFDQELFSLSKTDLSNNIPTLHNSSLATRSTNQFQSAQHLRTGFPLFPYAAPSHLSMVFTLSLRLLSAIWMKENWFERAICYLPSPHPSKVQLFTWLGSKKIAHFGQVMLSSKEDSCAVLGCQVGVLCCYVWWLFFRWLFFGSQNTRCRLQDW